jgi:hypothetical protein
MPSTWHYLQNSSSLRLLKLSLKGPSHEMDLAFDDMYVSQIHLVQSWDRPFNAAFCTQIIYAAVFAPAQETLTRQPNCRSCVA